MQFFGHQRRWVLAGCGVTALVLLIGCANPEKRYEWLSFFFDGVPDPNAPPPSEEAGVVAAAGSSNAVAGAQGAVFTGSLHPPFQERQCNKCHKSQFSQVLTMPREDLCFSCHDHFLDNAAYVHAPALSGGCLMCHHPHRSEEPHLLLMAGADLCLQCHEARDLSPVPEHADAVEAGCTSCHNPHKGSKRFFLRASSGPDTARAK